MRQRLILAAAVAGLVVLLLALAALSFMAVFKGGPLRAVVGGWVAVVGVAGAAVVLTLAVWHDRASGAVADCA